MHQSRGWRLGLAAAASILAVAGAYGRLAAQAPATPPVGSFVPAELIVRLTNPNSAEALTELLSKLDAIGLHSFETVGGLYLVRLPSTLSVASAAGLAEQLDGVAYAEPNFVLSTQVVPDDPSFSSLWGLHNTGGTGLADADIDAPEAWNVTTGSSNVVVTVIDSGIDYTHPDLAANMFRNEADCNSNGIDDDGNGSIDDCYGIDTYNGDGNPIDDNNHGTHVAGTIGAVGNNGMGVVGVNWNVRLMACKFLNSSGSGTTDGAVRCLDYVARMKDRGVNIVATNNSWGGGGFSQALRDAIAAQRQRGILFITSAGNSGRDNDAIETYPANYDLTNVISVASTTRSDLLSSFSNFGRRTVHLSAPGSEILSTTRNNTYSVFSGTSMAAPHVTGVAALLKAQDPSRDWRAIRNLLLSGGDSKASVANTVSGRRLNAAGSLGCSGSTVSSRLLPRPSTVSGSVGTAITLSALSINCASNTGSTVLVGVSNGQAVTLRDDGVSLDQAAGDGVYVGSFVPTSVPAGNRFVLTFPGGDTVTVEMQSTTPYSYSLTTYSYRQITGTALGLGDDTSASIASPFPILFGGSSYSTVFVSSNGNLNFTSAFNTFSNVALPTTARSGPLVAPFWDDLFATSSDASRNVAWAVTGSTPNRELIIEWRNITGFGCNAASETVTFQVVLFEGRSDLLFNYADVVFGGSCTSHDRGASATIGIQLSSTLGTQFSLNSSSLSDGMALRWTYGIESLRFTDDPLILRTTAVKAVHITELRARIDALRGRFSLAPVSWTDPTIVAGTTIVKAQHLAEMRTAVTQVYQAANVTAPSFTDGAVSPRQLLIKAQHIAELRAAVVNLEGTQAER
jgi:subtilisin family serine protease